MATMVWSMKVIATAKIIAAKTRFLDRPPASLIAKTPALSSQANYRSLRSGPARRACLSRLGRSRRGPFVVDATPPPSTPPLACGRRPQKTRFQEGTLNGAHGESEQSKNVFR